MEDKVDILAIGSHPDDVELSAGGTLLKHAEQGYKIAIVDLTEGELGSRGTVEKRYEEAANAASIIGVDHRENLKLPDGFFEDTQEALRLLITQIRRFQPKVVICNAPKDRHPDHGRGSDFASRACFLSGLLKIETNLNGENQEKWRPSAVYHYVQDRYLPADFVVDITGVVEQKMDVITAYESQFYNPKSDEPNTPISGKEFLTFLRGRWAQWGRSIGVDYGEGFTVERPPQVKDILKDIS